MPIPLLNTSFQMVYTDFQWNKKKKSILKTNDNIPVLYMFNESKFSLFLK